MTNIELAKIAEDYTKTTNCYLKGFWFQKITQAEYDRILKLYPRNSVYGNEKYIGSDCNAADCICFIKAITSGATAIPEKRITYAQLKAGPLGDCSNETFYDKLYDCLGENDEIPPGYGIASTKHAALTLGGNKWIDCNFNGAGQNGIAIHYSNPVKLGYKVGKIPGIVYENPEPETERETLMKFVTWLVDSYCNR